MKFPWFLMSRTSPYSMTILFLGFLTAHPAQAQKKPEKNPDQLKIALINIKSLYSDGPDMTENQKNIQTNLKRHLYFIDQAVEKGAEFVGFPELSLNGYRFSDKMTWLSLEGPEVKTLQKTAQEKGIYLAAGLAEQDKAGKRWNTHFVIDPKGQIIGTHRKIYLTKEKGFVEVGNRYDVFEVKGLKVGIAICADGSDKKNLKALVDNGAQLIYGPHANTTGGTTAGWYKFRAGWAGPDGWISEFKVYAALHNHAGLYHPDFAPPIGKDSNTGWASGAWIIGPDGKTLAQMPSSTDRAESKEFILIHNIPIPKR